MSTPAQVSPSPKPVRSVRCGLIQMQNPLNDESRQIGRAHV